jgi:thioesterase-3
MDINQILIGSSDIDQMNHLNNQKYITFLEKGRDELYERAGYSDAAMKELGLGRTVVQMNVSFQKEVYLGERLSINTYPISIGNSSFTLKQEVYNENSVLVASAKVTGVIFDLMKRKSISIPSEFKSFLERELKVD